MNVQLRTISTIENYHKIYGSTVVLFIDRQLSTPTGQADNNRLRLDIGFDHHHLYANRFWADDIKQNTKEGEENKCNQKY